MCGIASSSGRVLEEILRRSSVLTIAAISCLLFAIATMRLNPRSSSALAAQEQTSQPAAAPQGVQLQPSTLQLSLPPSSSLSQPRLQLSLETSLPALTSSATEIYTAKRGESIPAVAHQYLKRTGYLTSSELSEAIRQTNGNRSSNILNFGVGRVGPD